MVLLLQRELVLIGEPALPGECDVAAEAMACLHSWPDLAATQLAFGEHHSPAGAA